MSSTTRLSDEQIRETVANMAKPEDSKAAILKAALAGDGPSRFVVYREYKRQHGIVENGGRMAAWLAQSR